MRNNKKYYLLALLIGIMFTISFTNCNSNKDKGNLSYEIVSQNTYGNTNIIYCTVKDTNETKLIRIGEELCLKNKNKLTYIYYYLDKNKIKDISKSDNLYDAIPKDGFDAHYTRALGLIK